MVIKSPQKYAGRTLEGHLRLYDWKNEFYTFERTIKTSSFDGMCNSAYVPSKVSWRTSGGEPFSEREAYILIFLFSLFAHTDNRNAAKHHQTLPSTRPNLSTDASESIVQARPSRQRHRRERDRGQRKGKSYPKQSLDVLT